MFRSVAIDVYQKESGHGNVFVAMRLVKCTLRCDLFCLVWWYILRLQRKTGQHIYGKARGMCKEVA